MARIQHKDYDYIHIKVDTTTHKTELQRLMSKFSHFLSYDSRDMADFTLEKNKKVLNQMIELNVINFTCFMDSLPFKNETIFFIKNNKILHNCIEDYTDDKNNLPKEK